MAEQAKSIPSSPNRALGTAALARGIENLRWYICALIFLATILNYIDRQVFSILAPDLQRDIGWSELDYGRIVIAFQVSYAVSLILSGRLIDKIGSKLGYTLSIIWWSFAEIAHALSRTPFGFGAARAALGIGEAANFPTAMKTVAEWFPKTETGTATGLLNTGPTIGAIAAPLLVPLIAAKFGWKGAFVLTGVLGIPWVFAWWKFYDSPAVHPSITPEELAHIQGDRPAIVEHRVSLRKLLGYRQTWACAAGKVLADPAWFFYLFWLPKFLAQEHGLRGTAASPYLATVYVFCGVGSAIGGYGSSFLLRCGWSLNASRKLVMGVSAGIMPIVILAGRVRDPWTAVLLIGMTLAAHQSWSTMMYSTNTDLFPSQATASVTGLVGALGSASTILFAEITGRVLQRDPNLYLPMFIACGTMYMLALAIIHLLVPRFEPAKLD
jgi:ACS family hexuronate transporter-like MFS transporter